MQDFCWFRNYVVERIPEESQGTFITFITFTKAI